MARTAWEKKKPKTQTKFEKRVKEMMAPMYQPLLTPVYWVRPIYTELLHSSSRLRKDTRIETARPSNGLVKIMCSPKAQGETPINATAYNKGHTHWLGSASHVQSLYVWVPAHWAPKVCEVIKTRTDRVDSQRDQELQAARAWGQEPGQQPQRDGQQCHGCRGGCLFPASS